MNRETTASTADRLHREEGGSLFSGRPRARRRPAAGFSLVEVMVAMLILTFLILGVFGGLIQAYRLASHTRLRDHARYVLRSVGDQFLVQMAEQNGALLPLFTITTAPTGTGITWQGTTANAGTLLVTLGTGTGATINDAVLTRDVRYLDDSGAITASPPDSTAGMLLRGDFKISYVYNGKPIEQSLSLVRRVP